MGGKWNKWVHAKQTGCYLAANPSTAVAVHQPPRYVWAPIRSKVSSRFKQYVLNEEEREEEKYFIKLKKKKIIVIVLISCFTSWNFFLTWQEH